VLGAEFRHKFIDWTYLDAAHEEDFFALFAQDQWVLDEQWTVLVSGRLDRHPLIGFLGSPRGALIFKPTPTQALRLSVGTAFRQPTQSETYLSLTSSNGGVGVTLAGNRDLDPERILTFDLGYLNQGEIGQFEIVTYLNRVEGLIVRSDLVRTSPEESFDPSFGGFVAARSLYQNESTTYWAVGSEVAARAYPTDGLDLGASYAFQYIFDPETGDRFTDSPLHKINVWGQVRTDLGLDVGLSFSFTSSQEWREEISNPSPRDPVEAIQRVTLPLDAYAVLSGRVGYRLFDDALELSVVGSNLTQFGDARDSQHPLGNRTEARVLGVMKARF
jgi:outer membrane receptor protein involved in Fe transport